MLPKMDESQQKSVQEDWEEPIPPRRVLHASDKEKYLRIFYFILTFLFLLLTILLTIWGFHLIEDSALVISMVSGLTKV